MAVPLLLYELTRNELVNNNQRSIKNHHFNVNLSLGIERGFNPHQNLISDEWQRKLLQICRAYDRRPRNRR